MAITVAMRTEISQLYVALFGRAPDTEGLGFWVGQRNMGQTVAQIADAMYATAPARAYFPTWMTNQEIIGSFYQNVLGRTADAEGLAFWTAKLNAEGATPGSVIAELISAVANYDGVDPDGLESAALFNNRVEVAQYYAEHGGNIANATIVLDGVTSDADTVDETIADIDNGTVGPDDTAQTIFLEVGQDAKAGGSANDTFNSYVVQNSLGQQVNTLGSGDVLAGGAGTDSLMAKVTAGAFVGSNGGILGAQTMPIQPMTSGIEIVKIEAVNSAIGIGGINIPGLNELGLGLGETNVYINAKDMLGVDTIGSWHSDANLVIQNMTTQDDFGVARQLSEMTVVMGYTGNRDSHWSESDLSVYFDQDYLNPTTVFQPPSIDIQLMNEDAYDVTLGAKPLSGVYVAVLRFQLNGVTYDLAAQIDESVAGVPEENTKGEKIETYEQLLAEIEIAIEKLKALHEDDAALQTLSAEFGPDFDSDISPETGELRIGKTVQLSVAGSTNGVDNDLTVGVNDLQLLKATGVGAIENSNRYERAAASEAPSTQELRINVELEKVGLAGDGGELIIGSMFKDGQNEWADLYEGKGINIFDVTVSGAEDKPSSLAGMHSTGDNLREVIVNTNSSQTVSFADLTIGNSNTRFLNLPTSMELGDVVDPSWRNQGALKDVQTFNAAGLKGDLTLYAALTNDVVDKYMNVVDEAQDEPELDNIEFTYTGGTGNDYINLWLSDYNLAKAGSTTREDFDLTINGNAGNDEIVTRIGDGVIGYGEDFSDNVDVAAFIDVNGNEPNWDNWYDNSSINANLSINGDSGNDTIRTLGSGNWIIDGGSGTDTIYADNTGGEDTGPSAGNQDQYFNNGKATWVFNHNYAADGNDVEDLESQPGASMSAVNAQLTVHFMGYTSTAEIADSQGRNANVTITDLHINQAIKLAINSDPVLSKLLVAEDGPARTLIVRSLIDGHMGDGMADYGYQEMVDALDNLSVTFSNTGVLSPGQIATGADLFTGATGYAAVVDGYYPTADAEFGYDDDMNQWLDGEDSDNVADNEIEGGTENDVIVLGTGHFSNDTLVYHGLANGTDSIVNFQDNYSGGSAEWSGGEDEVMTLTFSDSDGDPVGQTIIFDGETVTLSAPVVQGVIPSEDVAFQFFSQFDSENWAVIGWDEATSSVQLQHKSPGDIDDAVAGDFTGTYITAGTGTVGIVIDTQGEDIFVSGSPTEFVVEFTTETTAADATDATQFTFDGVSVPVVAGDGSVTLVNAIMAQVGAFAAAGWTVTAPTVTSVQFVETTNAATPVPTAAAFGLNDNNIFGTIVGETGVEDTTIEPVFVVTPPGPMDNFDFIDFTSYNVTGVSVTDTNQVNDILGSEMNGIVGTVNNNIASKWITMVESTTNDGEYTIRLWTSTGAGAGDDSSAIIGVADFGYEKDFTDLTFFL